VIESEYGLLAIDGREHAATRGKSAHLLPRDSLNYWALGEICVLCLLFGHCGIHIEAVDRRSRRKSKWLRLGVPVGVLHQRIQCRGANGIGLRAADPMGDD
jgi:hypothetical protein